MVSPFIDCCVHIHTNHYRPRHPATTCSSSRVPTDDDLQDEDKDDGEPRTSRDHSDNSLEDDASEEIEITKDGGDDADDDGTL
jgi:hypothetical protein